MNAQRPSGTAKTAYFLVNLMLVLLLLGLVLAIADTVVGSGVGPFVLLAGALWLLRGLARSVREGDPFGPANVQRLRALGFLLVAGAPVVELVSWALRLSLANTLPPDAFGDVGFPAHGVRLREDVEGTV